MTAAVLDAPEIPILLLGDAGVGKSSFLSRLTQGDRQVRFEHLPVLRDLDQPFPFNARFDRKPYRLLFYDTASPEHYTLLKPAVIILCYSIADPATLESLKTLWRPLVDTHFNRDEKIPVVILGLKRDARMAEDYDGSVKPLAKSGGAGDQQLLDGRTIVYPQEGYNAASEMRCDTYCECSALDGDKCKMAFEDIAKKAALTTTAKGGRSEGTQCRVM